MIKINLIEAKNKYEDSHLPIINEIYEKILSKIDSDDEDLYNYKDDDGFEYLDIIELTDSNVNCERIDEFEDGSVEYIFNGKKLVGYRF